MSVCVEVVIKINRMGSIMVYDYQQRKWVKSNPDPDEIYQHFKDVRDGLVQPDYRGRYVIGSGRKRTTSEQPYSVKLVTPVAKATERVISELKRKKDVEDLEDISLKKLRF